MNDKQPGINPVLVIVGATSSIAGHVARLYAARRATFVLIGREESRLRQVGDDLAARGAASVRVIVCGTLDTGARTAAIEEIKSVPGGFDLALVAHGSLGDQAAAERDFEAARAVFEVNTLDVLAWVTAFANLAEGAGKGTVAVISSVAGDLGRRSNYVYGAAKAAVSTFMQGLAVRLHRAGARACTIKPGPVATPMTAGMTGLPFLAQPEDVALDIVRGLDRGRAVIYTPGIWRLILLVLKHLPFVVLRRLKL